MNGPNRIDPTGMRISTNLSIDRQTPKADFGDRVKAGLDTAGGAIANGVAVAAPLIPGGAIISAAVSSLGTLSRTSGAGAVSSQYAATGVVSVGGGTGGISTTVGGGIGGAGLDGTGGAVPSFMPTAVGQAGVPGGMMGQMNSGLSETAGQLGQMLQVQMLVQRENQVFTTVSNVLKTRHDTVKNTISNVR